jgi:hypothetical protein
MLTIKDTTGQDTITCINLNGDSLMYVGTSPSTLGNLIAGVQNTISNAELLVLNKELSAGIAPEVINFNIVPGLHFIDENGNAVDLMFNGNTVQNSAFV